MLKTTTLLEKRVKQAVERLQSLTEERLKLEEELSEARKQLEQLQLVSRESDSEDGDAVQRRQEALDLVRETLSELRAPA